MLRQMPHEYSLPSSYAMRQTIIKVAARESDKLLESFRGKLIHGASDGWTDKVGEAHEKKNTICLISGGQSFFYKTVGENVPNTGEYLKGYLTQTLEVLRSKDIIVGGISTDNAANVVKGVRLVSETETYSHAERIPFRCHCLQLIMDDLFGAGNHVL
ncbi:hypothetical protein KIPB_010764, partial [Kipferlia bialata]|eukprot:g10764.t1